MATRRIVSRAPTRIDLAGGTVDLWPLYLFLQKPVTINLGIDLFAEATIEETKASGVGEVLLKSQDQNLEMKIPWSALEAFLEGDRIQAPPALELHFRLLRYFVQRRITSGKKNFNFDLSLSTRAKSPSGAGLGGSSTLSVAIVGALAEWCGEGQGSSSPLDREKLVEIVRDVETTVIRVPAGVQDYYGAMFGGLQALHWQAGSHQREWLSDEALLGLEKRLLLFYSGQSRNSGINNWALFKSFIDNQSDVRTKFEKINRAAQSLEVALKELNWGKVGQAIADEWSARRTLAPGISTPDMDEAFAVSKLSGKVCGAGGGGCFFLYMEDPSSSEKDRVLKAVTDIRGIQSLPFKVSQQGLDVST